MRALRSILRRPLGVSDCLLVCRTGIVVQNGAIFWMDPDSGPSAGSDGETDATLAQAASKVSTVSRLSTLSSESFRSS